MNNGPNALRAEIARQVDEYIKRGGKITVLPSFQDSPKARCTAGGHIPGSGRYD